MSRAPWLPSTLARGSGLRARPQASDVFGLHDRIAGLKVVWSVAPKVFESERGFVIVSQSVKAVGVGGSVQAVHVSCGCSVKPDPVHTVHVVALTSGEAAFASTRWRLGGDGTSSDREPTHSAPSSDLQRMQSSELHHSCADTRAGRSQPCCGRDGTCRWPLHQSVSRPRA